MRNIMGPVRSLYRNLEGLTYEVATPALRGERNRSCGGVSQTAIISVRADGNPPGRWSIY